MTDRMVGGLLAGRIDWGAVLIYLALVSMGWLSIYAAVYESSAAEGFDITSRYGMQSIWIGVALFLAIVILLVDAKYYHLLTYPLYVVAVIVLIGVLFLGKEVNGARAWIVFGPVAIQPTEFVKFTTALAVARYMSNYTFSIRSLPNLIGVGVILLVPVVVIILQNDMGSALVYGSFLLMLYREGLNPWVYVVVGMAIFLFIISFLMTPLAVVVTVLLICVVASGFTGGGWRARIVYLASVTLGALVTYFGYNFFNTGSEMDSGTALLVTVAVSIPFVIRQAYKHKVRGIYRYILLFAGSMLFVFSVDYVFDNLMQEHQQKRILDLLGIEADLKGWGYNVNQSKIAIGSGGVFGKGFLNGTQTKYNFVPEQSTDFIFCTVGEEWGFVGSMVVLALFGALVLKLMRMGERQGEAFGRIYCYSVAGIFLFHVVINIGMTVGLVPVIGIPLPFFSYGGSSLLAFTILYFVAVKLDSAKAV